MAFAKLFRRKPTWQFNANRVVWKLLCSENLLLGDARDTEKKCASFFALDFRTGDVLWKDVALREEWWIGMQTICEGVLLLHGYEKPDMPLPKGIYALDCATGELLWENDGMTYLFSYNGRLYVRRSDFRASSSFAISLRTGAVEHDYGDNDQELSALRILSDSESQQSHQEGYVFPEYIQHHSEDVRNVLVKHINVSQVRGGIDVATRNGVAIASWHEPARGANAALNNLVMNKLNVVDVKTGSALYEDVLVATATAPTPDTFFIKDGMLMYVKEGTHVVGVALDEFRK